MSGSTVRSAPAVSRPLQFTEKDLAVFAAASGDRNPLHLDPAFARRSPFGTCIVHGSLVTLGLLGSLPDDVLARVRSLHATFGAPVVAGEPLTAEGRQRGRAGAWEVMLTGRGRGLARVVVSDTEAAGTGVPMPEPAAGRPMRTDPFAPGPGEPAVGYEVTGGYRPGAELAEIVRRWHVEALAPALLEGLAWASYAIGMELPGLNGLCAAVTLSSLDPDPEGLRGTHSLRLRERDSRSDRLLIDGVLCGDTGARTFATLEAFVREPVPEPDTASVLPEVPPVASGEAVVVIGGSRGFGAALVLAFLGRGHAVHALYSTSAGDAAELGRLAGRYGERLVFHRADASDPAALAALSDELSASGVPLRGLVLSAASPPLAMGVTADSAAAIGDYVAMSVRLAAAPLGALLPSLADEGFVLFCSSSALTAPPRGWPHYAAAKGAIEGLARWTASSSPGARSVVARLPKMLTDMTNSPSGRLDAVAPEAVAGRLVARLDSGGLPPGLTILEPEQL